MTISISVLVCSYDRYDLLQQTLDHFESAQAFRDGIELIVIENTPIDRRQKIRLPKNVPARVVICDITGLSAARNAGINASAHEIIAFLDDDALICNNWAHTLSSAFSDPRVQAVGGKVLPRYQISDLPNWFYAGLSGYLSCIDWGNEPRPLREGEWIVGANMAFRRRVFEAHGLFDLSLGRKGNASLLSNEEIELINKIGISSILYHPDCYVEHIISRGRITLEWFRKRVYWQAISDALANISYHTAAELRDEYGRIAAKLPAEYRNINMLEFQPMTQEQMQLQLRAIYISATLGCNGYAGQ